MVKGRQLDVRSADETLRMIARLPAPDGLEERVKAGLRLAERPGRVLAWPSGRNEEIVWAENKWMRSGWARGAAAAAIALVVAGGGWGIYTRIVPAQSAKTVALPQAQPSGKFSEAGAMRRPQTLEGPEVKGPGGLKPPEPKTGQWVPKRAGNTARVGTPNAANARAQGITSHGILPVQ